MLSAEAQNTRTLQNASGDTFEIWQAGGEWHAEQITGLEKNYMRIGALLHAPSFPSLKRELASHYSNS